METAHFSLRSWTATLCILSLVALGTTVANATCTTGGISGVTASLSPANLGSYTPGGAAPAQVIVPLTLNFTYLPGTTGPCEYAFGFQRSSLPATVNRPGGSTPIPYAANRPNNRSLLFSGAIPPDQRLHFQNANPVSTRNFNLELQLLPNLSTNTLGGAYSDSLTFVVHDRAGNMIGNLLTQIPVTVNATVTTTCSIANASNTSQVISVGSTGLTTGMQGTPPQFNVSCNSSSNVSLSSQNGAVTRGGLTEGALAAVSGFRNRIEYQATINGGAGAVSLNTSSGGAAVSANGVFNAAAVTSLGTTVTITPEASTVPLLAGSYSDVLTVTITPQ